MKQMIISILIFLQCFCLAQQSSNKQTETKGNNELQIINLNDSLFNYYPLQIGNTWIYKNITKSKYYTEKVLGDTIFNNKYYFKVQETNNVWFEIEINFYRKDTTEAKIYKKDHQDTFEWLVDSLFASVGDNWGFNSLDSVTEMTIFGQKIFVRHLHQLYFPPYFPQIGYAYNIGKVYRRAQYPTYPHGIPFITDGYDLVYALINGKEYGANPLIIKNENIQNPRRFSLWQNYPNPFNPTTKIRYSIPNVGTSLMKPVQLKIYDILGQEIATLVNEEKPAGNYEVEFDGSNHSSGVYLYRIQAGDFIQTKKMILLR